MLGKFPLLLILTILAICAGPFHARALEVPLAECPCTEEQYIASPECHPINFFVCHRTDGVATLVDEGTPYVHIGAKKDCNNCANMKCADCEKSNPLPPNMECTDSLTVAYNSAWTVSITAGGSFDTGPVEVTIEAEVGHSWSWEYSNTSNCGSSEWPPCRFGTYANVLNIVTNQKWQVRCKYGVSSKWGDYCGAGNTPGNIWPWTQCPGTQDAIVTATGTIIGSSECKFLGYGKCPLDRP